MGGPSKGRKGRGKGVEIALKVVIVGVVEAAVGIAGVVEAVEAAAGKAGAAGVPPDPLGPHPTLPDPGVHHLDEDVQNPPDGGIGQLVLPEEGLGDHPDTEQDQRVHLKEPQGGKEGRGHRPLGGHGLPDQGEIGLLILD